MTNQSYDTYHEARRESELLFAVWGNGMHCKHKDYFFHIWSTQLHASHVTIQGVLQSVAFPFGAEKPAKYDHTNSRP